MTTRNHFPEGHSTALPVKVATAFALSATLLCALCSHHAARAEDVGLVRWAIVASKNEQASSVADLLTARLSGANEIELVERDRLNEIFKELELTELSSPSSAGKRLSLGKLLKADGLVLISHQQRGGNSALEVMFSDTTYGLRLRREYHSAAKGADEVAKQLAESLTRVRKDFAGGVKQVVCVTPFVSKSLGHDFDHWQVGYANLLENALRDYPGVACVETLEARSISSELAVSGEQLQEKIVPLFIEGEYEVAPSGKRTVDLSVRITDGKKVQKEYTMRQSSMAEVTDLLTGRVPAECIQLAQEAPEEFSSAEQQFANLVRRADEFAALAFWEHSTALREAALLIQPGHGQQTIRLTMEYYQMLAYHGPRVIYAPSQLPDSTEEPRDVWGPRLWRSMIHHIEATVNKRQVSQVEADLLIYAATRAAVNLGGKGIEPWRKETPAVMAEISRFWRPPSPPAVREQLHQFFVHVYPAVARLDAEPGEGGIRKELQPLLQPRTAAAMDEGRADGLKMQMPTWEQGMLENVRLAIKTPYSGLSRWQMKLSDGFLINGQHHAPGHYYDTVHSLLTTVPLNGFKIRLSTAPVLRRRTGWSAKLTPLFDESDRNLDGLVTKLEQTKRPDLVFAARRMVLERAFQNVFLSSHGRSALAGDAAARARLIEDHDKLLNQADALIDLVQRSGYRSAQPPPPWDPIVDLRRFKSEVSKSMKRWQPTSGVKNPRHFPPKAILRPDPGVSTVVLKPVSGIEVAWANILNCDDRFDLMWPRFGIGSDTARHRRLEIMRTKGKVETLFRLQQWPPGTEPDNEVRRRLSGDQIVSVKWDGSRIWLASKMSGVYLLDETGATLSHWHETEGFPKYDGRLILKTLEAGRCLVLGLDGQVDKLPRAWIALLEYKRDGPQEVRVIHSATKAVDETDAADQTFDLKWVADWANPKDPGTPLWLIGRKPHERHASRWSRCPLVVDLNSLEVTVSPWNFPEFSPGRGVYEFHHVTPDGEIVIPSYYGTARVGPPSGQGKRWTVSAPKGEGVWTANPSVRTDDGLFVAGYDKLFHYDAPGSPPKAEYNTVLRNIADSAHYGLVTNTKTLHQVTFGETVSESQKLAQLYPRVPDELRKSHHEAIQAIRRLGGRTGGHHMGYAVEIDKSWRGGQEGFKHLKSIHGLGCLWILQTPVTNETMQEIGNLSTLTWLNLYETGLTDADMEPLANLTKLQRLRLEGTASGGEFSDEVLLLIQRLPIDHLWLYGKGFTKKSVEYAFQIRTLRHLSLYDTGVPAQVIEQRRATLPEDHFIHVN